MELRLLNKEGLTALYQNEMTGDFPRSELKPLAAMLRLMDLGRYDPLLVVQDGQTVGYAMLWLAGDRAGALLEYLGVLRGKRSGGLGTRILALLADRYGQLFGEAEAPGADASPAENGLRRRRIAFYERNGFRVLDYQCALFGVRFHCLYRGPEADDRKVEALHRGVYAEYFSPAHMERYIQLPLKPGEAVKPAPEWVEEAFPGGLQYRSLREEELSRPCLAALSGGRWWYSAAAGKTAPGWCGTIPWAHHKTGWVCIRRVSGRGAEGLCVGGAGAHGAGGGVSGPELHPRVGGRAGPGDREGALPGRKGLGVGARREKAVYFRPLCRGDPGVLPGHGLCGRAVHPPGPCGGGALRLPAGMRAF